MKALGGRGMYPSDRRLPGGTRRLDGGGGGDSEGGKRCGVGEDGSAVDMSSDKGSLYVTGVTFGAKVTDFGDGEGAP